LLVDDEEDFAQTLASRLRERGFQVDVALSGEEAIEKLDGAEATTEDKPELS
jgi:DNA-binding response OmpR family regulator